MIKYNLNTINDWNFGDNNIIKVYRNNAVCYYKIDSSSPSGQTPCYAVVADISQYSDTEFEDVYDKSTEKWYKLNNLSQYEEYGIYGDSIASGGTSRLPQGYTEVEYVENTTSAYLNLGINPTNAIGNSFTIETKINSSPYESYFEYIFSNEQGNTSPYYGFGLRWYQRNMQVMTSDETNYTSALTQNSDSTSSFTLSVSSASRSNTTPITLFCGLQGSTVWRNGRGKFYSFKLTLNNTLVRNLIPCIRDNDNMVGMYDIVNDVFYYPPNYSSYQLVAGSAVTPTAATYYQGKLAIVDGYEYIYSGSSWVNVGEVSGSTIDTVWIDPPSTNNQNASFTVGHYWGEGYKMIMNTYLSGSYSSDVGSIWRWNQHTPIEFNFYSNGFYYDFHNPTSTTSPDVYTGDYSWRIMKNSTLRRYENGQILNVILSNGAVRVELESTGAAIVTGSTSVSTQSWYNGLYQVDLGIMNTSNKCHTSRIQVYNANDELVNDIKFVKNQGVTGSQEISAYDSVLNVTYNNTNSYTPSYHIVSESGGTEYPIYYDEIQDPPNNLVFSSMAEAEAYECPWVGMNATIDGDRYVFSGDSISGYEWVYYSSRLPFGYTEVEYIQNTSHAYLDIGFIPDQDTRIVCDMQQVTENSFPRLWGAGEWNSANGINLNYEGGYLQMSWFGKTSWTKITSVTTNNDRHTYDLNKNYLYVDETLVGSNTYTTKTAAASIGIFCEIRNNGQPPTSGNNPQYWEGEYFKGKMYSFQVYNNGTLARDLVPCVRDNDNKAGAYDLVNDVFYTVPTGYTTDKLVAGDPV